MTEVKKRQQLRIIGLALVVTAMASTFAETPTAYHPSGSSSRSHFGAVVASFGDHIFVGAQFDGERGEKTGAVYVFNSVAADFEQILRMEDHVPGALFGTAIAVDAQGILVGAPGNGRGWYPTGTALLFDADSRTIKLELLSPNPTPADRFGASVAFLGLDPVVGAPGAAGESETATRGTGAVFLFDGSTGDPIRIFQRPVTNPGARFGASVAVTGGDLLVGAPFDRLAGRRAGAVYLFDGETGDLLLTLANPSPARDDMFGASVAAVGGNILVGAPGVDAGWRNSGLVYLFDRNTGELLQKFQNPEKSNRTRFGMTVGALEDDVLVGAPGADAAGADTGAVYRFEVASGGHLTTYLAPNPATNDMFGSSFAAMDDRLIVGAPGDDSQRPEAGAFYLFHD